MDGSGRCDRRTLLVRSLTLGTLAWVTACGSEPEPPTITDAEVQELQDHYAHKSFRARHDRDQKLITSIQTGPLLERELASMALYERMDAPKSAKEFSYMNSVGHPVRRAGDDDQERLLTTSNYSNAPADWCDLGLYTRPPGTKHWRRTFGAGLYADDLPSFGKGEPVQAVAPDASDYLALPITMPSVIAHALQDPASEAAAGFAASEARRRYADELAAGNKKVARIGTITRHYQPGDFLVAVETASGYLALGSFTFTQTLTAWADKEITFKKKSPQYSLFPDAYHRTTYGYGAMFAVLVPKEGKIIMICGEERQTDLTAE